MGEYDAYLNLAVKAAQSAGDILKRYYGQSYEISIKENAGIVTQADKEAEAKVISIIRETYPKHSILAEESGLKDQSSEFRWVIDPLDGTTNFAHQIPFFCVSIGLVYNQELIVAAVYDPTRNDLYTAQKNGGAYCNGQKLRVSQTEKLSNALFATGFAYQKGKTLHEQVLFLEPFIQQSHGIRRTGSAVLDFCHVAAGHFDGFFERNLQPWDVAAGILLVEEAGGATSRYDNSKATIYDHEIVASNKLIHNEMISILKK